MKLRIESDGTVANTHLFTESGDLIQGVQDVTWFASRLGGTVDCVVTFKGVRLDAVVDAEIKREDT